MTAPHPDESAAATSSGSAPVKATVTEGTEYVVLVKATEAVLKTGSSGWVALPGVVTARTAANAINEAASKRSEQAGEYIAIPLRSWKSYTVTPQTVTTLKLEEAK